MKIWLDDIRPAPEGWHRCYWPNEVILLLQYLPVKEISLDHDLGDDETGTGYKVLAWLEEQLYLEKFPAARIPTIHIHTANPVARDRMEDTKRRIEQYKKPSA